MAKKGNSQVAQTVTNPVTLDHRFRLEQLTVACSAPSTEEYVTALPDGGEGWHSTHYGSKEPSWCRRITATGNDITFVTAIGCSLRLEAKSLYADGEEYPLE